MHTKISLDASFNQPAQPCERGRELGRLVPLWPNEINDTTILGRRRMCRLLMSALRRERQRGIAGHWTYDVSRHAALSKMLRRETNDLRRLMPHATMPAANSGIEVQMAR